MTYRDRAGGKLEQTGKWVAETEAWTVYRWDPRSTVVIREPAEEQDCRPFGDPVKGMLRRKVDASSFPYPRPAVE